MFGNVDFKLKDAEAEIHALDLGAEARNLIEAEVVFRNEMISSVWKLRKRKELLWL